MIHMKKSKCLIRDVIGIITDVLMVLFIYWFLYHYIDAECMKLVKGGLCCVCSDYTTLNASLFTNMSISLP